ncbi:hypothetical protein [Fodinibius sp.]|uniref:hypothetical protein n=1 Tax=Fodinibius sp. TaxID=1872440 RepID=UPI002ACEE3BD|nr:hypothetical protein [Fodinibius sp.]MDZ7658588.1 hypothetical protein [Fodinibius sp.]
MDIFKLFFDHDLRLDKLAKRNANKTKKGDDSTIEDFMKPDPTYSKFYITGTDLNEERFGINVLSKSNEIIDNLNSTFKNHQLISTTNKSFDSIKAGLQTLHIGEALVISNNNKLPDIDLATLTIDEETKVGHKKDEIRSVIESGAYLLYKEPAHHGFDLHLFSEQNIYPHLFETFKSLVDNEFRFFSINNKRMRSERHFYFETWTLDNPPHGAEEVFPETVL